MDITISFVTTVGFIKAFNLNESIFFDVINNSIVMSLKNKKFPRIGGENINNRDANKRYPPFPDIPGLIAIVSNTTQSESERYSLDEYLSDRESSIAGFFFWGYAAIETTKTRISDETRTDEGVISTTGERGSPNLNYSFFVPYGPYEGSGGSGSYNTTTPYSTSSIFLLSKSQYISSLQGRSSSVASESFSETTGTTDVLGMPSIYREKEFSKTTWTVIFKRP